MRTLALALPPLLAGCLLIAIGAAQADTVRLANGDRLTGRVLHLSPETLTLETAYAGVLTIQRTTVLSIETDEPVDVLVDGQPRPTAARLADAGNGRVVVAPAEADGAADRAAAGAAAGDAAELPMERISYINPSPYESGIGVAYKGRVTLSSAQSSGNTSNNRFFGDTQFDARAMRYAYNLGLKGTRSTDAGKRVASNWFASGNYDRFIAEHSFLYARASLEEDRFRSIELRTIVGGGYGVRIFDSEQTQLSVRGGVDLVSFRRTTGGSEQFPALGWGVRAAHWLWDRRLELFHEQTGFWNLDDTAEATLRSSTGVRVPIAQGLSASAQYNVNWERRPEPGRVSTDSVLLLGLGYEW